MKFILIAAADWKKEITCSRVEEQESQNTPGKLSPKKDYTGN